MASIPTLADPALQPAPSSGPRYVALSVIAPCYNEEANVRALTERVLAMFDERSIVGELVLVNDASTDQTGPVLDELAQQHQRLVVVHHETNRGIEGGWRSGLQASQGSYVCFMDADLQNLPEDVWRLYSEIRFSGLDMVQGYRSAIGRLRNSRYLLSKGLNIMLNLLMGMRLRDNKSGFVIATRECMEDVLEHQYRYDYFQTFITVAAHAKRYSIGEIETLFVNRLAGESFIKKWPLRLVSRVFIDVIKAFLEYRVFRKRRSVIGEHLAAHPPKRRDPPLRGLRALVFHLFFLTMPLHKWLISSNAKWLLARLKESQWLEPTEIKTLQERRLRRLVRHAYRTVPYYRNMMDAQGIRPEEVQTLEDLRSFPLLGKDDVRKNLYFDLFASDHDKSQMLRIATSGSTGEPFVIYVERSQLEMRWASTWRATEWTGWRFGDRQARLWHQTLGMSWSQVARERIDSWFMRRLFIPAYDLTDENLPHFMRKLRRHKPTLVDGYAECFNFLAYYARTHEVEGVRPRAVMSSAQALPEQVRRTIEEQFHTRVHDKYGSREFSGIAYECEQQEGHHVQAESYIVELLKDGRPARPGEVGEVVVTDLNNFCVPLIRYRVGDLATAMDAWEPCACGRGLPRIGDIQGRTQAIVVCEGGKWLPGTYFSHFFKDYDHIVRQYQVVQQQEGAFELKIVKGSQFNDHGFYEELMPALRQTVGHNMQIDVQFVDEIPLGRTGKRQGVVSRLGLDFQAIEAAEGNGGVPS